MSPHEKSHGNNFQDHLHCVYDQKDEIDGSIIFGNTVHLLVEGEEEAVYHDHEQDESIEPGVDGNQLDDLVSEWVGHRQATK